LSQESEQRSITIEESAENLRDGKDPLSVRDIMQDIVFNPAKPDESSFLSTRRAEASCFTREGNEEIITALRTSDPCASMFQNSTVEVLINSFGDDRAQEAEILFIFFRIDVFVLLEVKIDDFIEGGLFWSSSFINFRIHAIR
jgi:hypothetical protein